MNHCPLCFELKDSTNETKSKGISKAIFTAAAVLLLSVDVCLGSGLSRGMPGSNTLKAPAIESTAQYELLEESITNETEKTVYDEGKAYYDAGDYEKAFPLLQKAAEQGNANAQNDLGDCYFNGDGVEQDKAEAVKWYRMAAEQGIAAAQVNLGFCYDYEEGVAQDSEEAVKWYRLAAEQGNAEAQTNLGICYENGAGVEQDPEEAVKWYRIAVEQGDARAQVYLGNCYYNGSGVKQDLEEAVKWYRIAAEQEYSYAQICLGTCYYNGGAVEQDLEEAAKWYRLAAEQGNEVAEISLGSMYYNGEGVELNYAQCLYWFILAARQGYETAIEYLNKWNVPWTDEGDLNFRTTSAEETIKAENGNEYRIPAGSELLEFTDKDGKTFVATKNLEKQGWK